MTESEIADAAQLSSLADETPEGRSIVVLAKERYGRNLAEHGAVFVPFTAQTRMSGVDLDGREIRKGAADSIERYVTASGGSVVPEADNIRFAEQLGAKVVKLKGGRRSILGRSSRSSIM